VGGEREKLDIERQFFHTIYPTIKPFKKFLATRGGSDDFVGKYTPLIETVSMIFADWFSFSYFMNL